MDKNNKSKKIVYKKTDDYENNLTTTSSDCSNIDSFDLKENLDDSILTLNDNINYIDSNENIRLLKNINDELKNDIQNKNIEKIKPNDNNNHNFDINLKLLTDFKNFIIKKNLMSEEKKNLFKNNEYIKKIIKLFTSSYDIKNINCNDLKNILIFIKNYTNDENIYTNTNINNNEINQNTPIKSMETFINTNDINKNEIETNSEIKNELLLGNMSSNDINTWIFMGIIIISIIIIIMIMINNK